jgi:hypothetical protein
MSPAERSPNQIVDEWLRTYASRHLDADVSAADLARLADMAMAALRSEGLLVTPEMRAVLDKAKAWRAEMSDEDEPFDEDVELTAAVDALGGRAPVCTCPWNNDYPREEPGHYVACPALAGTHTPDDGCGVGGHRDDRLPVVSAPLIGAGQIDSSQPAGNDPATVPPEDLVIAGDQIIGAHAPTTEDGASC